jgi:hypothetical protein
MGDSLFSRQQYDTLILRLKDISDKLSILTHKEPSGDGYLEAHEIIRQYHISKRTLERWRASGQVPFRKTGNLFYFNVDEILGRVTHKGKQHVSVVGDDVCVSEKQMRERHRRMLLSRRFYKVPS